MHISINPLPPEVSEKSLSKREHTVILCAWSESVPSTPDHITSHAEVLDGPVLCPNLLRMRISHPGEVVWLHTRVLVKHEKRAGYLLDNMLEQQ